MSLVISISKLVYGGQTAAEDQVENEHKPIAFIQQQDYRDDEEGLAKHNDYKYKRSKIAR